MFSDGLRAGLNQKGSVPNQQQSYNISKSAMTANGGRRCQTAADDGRCLLTPLPPGLYVVKDAYYDSKRCLLTQ